MTTSDLPAKPLIDDLQAMLATVPGAPERERLLAVLPGAHRVFLDRAITSSILDTVNVVPHTVEQSLDFLKLPAEVCWFEWSEPSQSERVHHEQAEHPDRIGVFLAYAYDDKDTIVGTVAWRFLDGRVDHAPAYFTWNETQLADLAQRAQHSYSHVPRESWARMVALVYTYVPDGYVGEMETLEGLRDDAPDIETLTSSTRREVSAETLMTFCALLAFQTSDVEKHDVQDWCMLGVGRSPRSMGLPSVFRKSGFFRKQPFRKRELREADQIAQADHGDIVAPWIGSIEATMVFRDTGEHICDVFSSGHESDLTPFLQ